MSIEIVSFAYAGTGTEASGGDKIFVEFAKRWAKDNHVRIHTTEAGRRLAENNEVRGVSFETIRTGRKGSTLPLLYLAKTVLGCIQAFRAKLDHDRVVIYSSSDFWPDSLPAFIMKKRAKNAKWAAGFYLFAPNPFGGATELEYRGGLSRVTLSNLGYFFTQKLIYDLARRSADFVIVANELDKMNFVKDHYQASRIRAIYGGVDLPAISQSRPLAVKYDGCFVGRLHPQKGPLQLIQIWKRVCEAKPDASLALIGEGPLEEQVRKEIKNEGLADNIHMMGWVEGNAKYAILKSSKVFLHTPILDTGGMAAAEGMACGLPVVAFDLPGYRYSYPRGMIKVRVGDVAAFARAVTGLLEDERRYTSLRKEALAFSAEWNWDSRASAVLEDITTLSRNMKGFSGTSHRRYSPPFTSKHTPVM